MTELRSFFIMQRSCFLLLLFSLGGAQAEGWWMDQPYEDDSYFNSLAEYITNTTLECSDDRMDPSVAYTFLYWVRPDLTVMDNSAGRNYEEFKTLDGPAGWRVENGNMTIFNVQEQQFGFYHCVLHISATPDDVHVVKRGLNYKGAYFGDLWEIYRLNVIIGCSAGVGFLVACLLIYGLQRVLGSDNRIESDLNGDDQFVNAYDDPLPVVISTDQGSAAGSYSSLTKRPVPGSKNGSAQGSAVELGEVNKAALQSIYADEKDVTQL